MAGFAGILGVSFLGQTGSVTIAGPTSTASTSLVFPFSAGAAAPTGAAWAYGGSLPVLSAAAVGVNGDVTTAGDLALVDATASSVPSASEVISVYLTDAAQVSADMSSYVWPVELYCETGTSSGSGSTLKPGKWSLVASGTAYVTNEAPSVSWSVTPTKGQYCEVAMDGEAAPSTASSSSFVTRNELSGGAGSFYTYSTSAATGTLSPTFYITAQEAGGPVS